VELHNRTIIIKMCCLSRALQRTILTVQEDQVGCMVTNKPTDLSRGLPGLWHRVVL